MLVAILSVLDDYSLEFYMVDALYLHGRVLLKLRGIIDIILLTRGCICFVNMHICQKRQCDVECKHAQTTDKINATGHGTWRFLGEGSARISPAGN